MSLLGLRHVALRVRDPQASKSFYLGCFGMSVVWEPDPDNVYLSTGTDNLALHRGAPTGPGALDHLGFVVGSRIEVDEWAARLQAAGVRLVGDPRDHRDGSRSFYCLDPDDLKVQILYEPSISAPRGD